MNYYLVTMKSTRITLSLLFFALIVLAGFSQDNALEKIKEFHHPGILVNREMLDFVKKKVKAGEEPWKSAFENMLQSKFAALSYAPGAIDTVKCGPYSKPDIGCGSEKNDVIAAYTHALLWYITEKEAYAKKSIEIMNDWSAKLKDHTNHNAPLQSAWCASVFPRAAEIIKHTYNGWPPLEVKRFEDMLRNIYLPKVINGSATTNGNWELSMIEASMAIGVFLDDKLVFDKAVSMWRKRVPAYIYMESDGTLPVRPPGGKKDEYPALIKHWYGQEKFVNGLGQETCRDLGHMQYGLAAIINAAETARIQGVNLYAEEAKRIIAGLEFNAQFMIGTPVPEWLCQGKLKSTEILPMWEIACNEYITRDGFLLPNSEAVRMQARPTRSDHHMAWETLTHAGLGKVGIK